MKRTLALLAAAAVVATPLVSEAAPKPPKKSTRVVSFDYMASTATSNPGFSLSLNNCGLPDQCFDFDTVKGEKNVVLAATDNSGRPVGFQIFLDDDFQSVQTVCGSGKVKVSTKSGTLVSVRMATTETCQGIPTEGKIKATITNF